MNLPVRNSATAPFNLLLVGLGGTIAGAGEARDGRYKSGQKTAEELVAAIPIPEGMQVRSHNLFSLGSQDITPQHWLDLLRFLDRQYKQDAIDAIVITHGTDTLEETALFLWLTYCLPVPVILTAAMHPDSSLGADGPLNLYQSMLVARHLGTQKSGVLVVFDQIIYYPCDLMKQHTTAVSAFARRYLGEAGTIQGSQVSFSAQPLGVHRPKFEVPDVFPKVGILFLAAGIDPDIISAYVGADYKGLVVAGVGNGNISQPMLTALDNARAQGVKIVRTTRVPFGEVGYGEFDEKRHDYICGCHFTPQGARVLLLLGLAWGYDDLQLKELYQKGIV